MTCSFDLENRLFRLKYKNICGVDEVGRGALFGPVVSGAVILDPMRLNFDIDDSKKVPEGKRRRLAEYIYKNTRAFSIGWCWNDQIDEVNIVNATRSAMRKAVRGLQIIPDYVLMDGMDPGFLNMDGEGIIKGDSKSLSIAAASIIAKVFRDDLMNVFSGYFREYSLSKNKGYPTVDHIEALRKNGSTCFHRKSFRVKNG